MSNRINLRGDQRVIVHNDLNPPGMVGEAVSLDDADRGIIIERGGEPISIRLADTNHQRNSARTLINRMYSWRGYGDHHVIPQSPTHITFTASTGSKTVGTITLAVDSPAGLAADNLFKDEIDVFRRESGSTVCELTKLAFDTEVPSKPLLASIFHLVFIYGHRRHKGTDLFIEVNPRHSRYYEVMLGFQRVGELKMNQSVSAPSQLMWLKVSKIRERINESAGSAGIASSRSLYPHFFSPTEEDGLFARMIGRNPTMAEAGAIPVTDYAYKDVLCA